MSHLLAVSDTIRLPHHTSLYSLLRLVEIGHMILLCFKGTAILVWKSFPQQEIRIFQLLTKLISHQDITNNS